MEQGGALAPTEIAKRDEIIAAVITSFESKNVKLVLIGINILQKLMLLHGLKDVRRPSQIPSASLTAVADRADANSSRAYDPVRGQKSIPAIVASLRDVQELGTDVQLKSLQVILVMVTSYAAVQGPTLYEVRPPPPSAARAASQLRALAVLSLRMPDSGESTSRGGACHCYGHRSRQSSCASDCTRPRTWW